MDINVDKLKAIVGLAIDKMATTLIQDIAGQDISLKNYSYDYSVLIEREYVSLVIQYTSQEVLKTFFFYTLVGGEDGSIKISLSDSEENEVLSLDFNSDFDFERVISDYS